MFGRQKRLLLSCPHCGHQQEEPVFARSTFCRNRACGAHYRIEDGKPVPEAPPATYPFPLRAQLASAPPEPDTAQSKRISRSVRTIPHVRQLELFPAENHRDNGYPSPGIAPQAATNTTTSGDHPAIARLARLLPAVPRAGHRHVHCLECGFPQSILEQTLSTMCPRCTASIPLKDYEIHTMRHRCIRTRGNVHVYPEGGIRGVSIQCHNLTIEGDFSSSTVDCDGDLIISHAGQMTGMVNCRQLIVKDGVEVVFLHPVHAQEVVIDGLVRGDITCARTLHLEEKAVLEGGLQGRTISISKGARHCGKLSVPEGEHHPNSEGIKSPAAPEQSLSEILEDQEEEGPFCP